MPDYIDVDHNKMTAKFVAHPGLADVPYAGADGTEPGHRILLALIGSPQLIQSKAAGNSGLLLIGLKEQRAASQCCPAARCLLSVAEQLGRI